MKWRSEFSGDLPGNALARQASLQPAQTTSSEVDMYKAKNGNWYMQQETRRQFRARKDAEAEGAAAIVLLAVVGAAVVGIGAAVVGCYNWLTKK